MNGILIKKIIQYHNFVNKDCKFVDKDPKLVNKGYDVKWQRQSVAHACPKQTQGHVSEHQKLLHIYGKICHLTSN